MSDQPASAEDEVALEVADEVEAADVVVEVAAVEDVVKMKKNNGNL